MGGRFICFSIYFDHGDLQNCDELLCDGSKHFAFLRMVCVCCPPLFSVSEMKTFFLVECRCSFCINIGCM